MEALWYAQHGYRVIAYDNSSGMIEQLRVGVRDRLPEVRLSRTKPGTKRSSNWNCNLELQPNSKQCSLRPESCRFILIFDRRRPSSDVLGLRTPVAHVLVPSEYSLLKC